MVKLPKPSIGDKSKAGNDKSKTIVSKVVKKTGKLVKPIKSEEKSKILKNPGKVEKSTEKIEKIQIKKNEELTKVTKKINKKVKIVEKNGEKVEDSKMEVLEAPRGLVNEVKSTKRASEGKLKVSSAEKPRKKLKTTVSEESPKIESKPKKKTSKVTKKEGKIGNLEVTKSHVRKCVQAVLKLTMDKENEKKTLLPVDNSPIFLQVTCIKVPKTPRRQLRIFLPHMMIGPTDEVALFVPDLEKGQRKNHEKTIYHWESILQSKNVTRIKEIIPINKVKSEYSQYEMKLKLGRMFDFFLIDGRISGHMTHILGKTFRKSAEPPTPVKLQRDNLKSEIDNALRKTRMEIHGYGNCHTLRVATVTMPEDEIVDNIIAACEALKKEYPGGEENIRSIFIKSSKSLGLPVYFSIQNKNKVAVTKIAPKRPKAFKAVEGELSTASGNVTVKLEPGGRIELKKVKKVKEEDVDKKAQ